MGLSNCWDGLPEVGVSREGAQRLRRGHLWVYAGDIVSEPESPAPVVCVVDAYGNSLGCAFYSSRSQIRLRLLSREKPRPVADILRGRIGASIERRRRLGRLTPEGACRLVFGESDLLPSVIVDRYGDCIVLQTLSSGADAFKHDLIEILRTELNPAGILERNDVRARILEGLDECKGVLWGSVGDRTLILEDGVKFLVDLKGGQKTGFFLDQSDNRIAAKRYASGRSLDCFSNTGAFALHFALRCESVLAVDVSGESLALGRENAKLNGAANIEFRESNVFDLLREFDRAGETFDTVCLDPPAFAKNRASIPAAKGGYKEVNLRAIKVLRPGGILITSSCSYHLSEPDFLSLIQQAARDAHRDVQLLEKRIQAADHPALVGMTETLYLKCLILRVL